MRSGSVVRNRSKAAPYSATCRNLRRSRASLALLSPHQLHTFSFLPSCHPFLGNLLDHFSLLEVNWIERHLPSYGTPARVSEVASESCPWLRQVCPKIPNWPLKGRWAQFSASTASISGALLLHFRCNMATIRPRPQHERCLCRL
jgi:hypothetical protein